MKYYLILFSIYLNSSFAQNNLFFVKDKTTNEPISLVAISTQKGNGTYSNDDGSFNITNSINDTLYISHLSYKNIVLLKKDIDNLVNHTIYLTPKVIELTETIIRPSKSEKYLLGYYKEKTFFKRVGPGGNTDFSVYVNHLKNISKNIGYINKLYFDLYVDIAEKTNSKVRIRVFSVGLDGLPKDDILNKEIIKKIDRFTPNLRVDISNLNIIFPPEGVFIGLEFFCNFEIKNLKKSSSYKIKTDCPHIPTAKVSNFENIGNSYYWTLVKGKYKWVCYSNGSEYKGLIGHVFKFGAEVSQ
jgi:hypothetical protein